MDKVIAVRCKGIVSKGVFTTRAAAKIAVVATLLYASASLVLSPVLAGPIHEAAKAGNVAEVERLVATGADVNAKDAARKTALHWAAEKGHLGVVQVLVAKGANVNAKDLTNWTPLHLAVYDDHEAIVKLLIAKGADVNAKDNDGISILDRPAFKGYMGIIAMLKSAGAKCGTNYYQSKLCREHLGSK